MKKTFKLLALVAMGAALALTACDRDETVDPAVCWVDLGLPSGLLWADCNLGASKPEEYGNLYAWGEISSKDSYAWETYRYCTVDAEGSLLALTKYNNDSDYGMPDSLITLLPADDAATAQFGGGARMPTADEWRELRDNTDIEWTQLNDVYGCRLTSRTNGKTLFLPAAGRRAGSELLAAGKVGGYWSSSLFEDHPDYAWYFDIYSANQFMFCSYRYVGRSVRPVCSAR